MEFGVKVKRMSEVKESCLEKEGRRAVRENEKERDQGPQRKKEMLN